MELESRAVPTPATSGWTMIPTQQIESIVRTLEEEYRSPDLQNLEDPIDELVFILLSDRTDERKYLAAFRNLKNRFPEWERLLTAPTAEIRGCIDVAGMGHRRAVLICKMLRAIVERFGSLDVSILAGMSQEEAERELRLLPGVGAKAARCVLLYCFEMPILPVDVHTYRLAIRLGILSRRVSYEQSHEFLPRHIPEKFRRAFHVNAVAHGRARCFAHKPKCGYCPLAGSCNWPTSSKPLPINVRPSRLVIDLFAGAGGLSHGFRKAGFQVVQALENDVHAATTYRHNHSRADLLEEDIHGLDPLACLDRLALRPGDVSVLIGGPPCRGFSESNRRTRTLSNPTNYLYQEFLRFLEAIEPAWLVIENVAGLKTLAKGEILNQIIERCQRLGYKVEWKELNSADYGVPQRRRRIFIVGNRVGLPVRFPQPTHGNGRKAYTTVWEAISDLPHLENGASIDYLPHRTNGNELTGYQLEMSSSEGGPGMIQGNLVSHNGERIIERYQHIAAVQNWETIPAELMDNYQDSSRCHTGIYHRLANDRPAIVIGNFRKNMLIHPEQNRGLSVREAARLQSFPDDYVFLGSIGFQQQKVADAVPPLLAESVARTIRSAEQRRTKSD